MLTRRIKQKARRLPPRPSGHGCPPTLRSRRTICAMVYYVRDTGQNVRFTLQPAADDEVMCQAYANF